jgi:hypothetical protein
MSRVDLAWPLQTLQAFDAHEMDGILRRAEV